MYTCFIYLDDTPHLIELIQYLNLHLLKGKPAEYLSIPLSGYVRCLCAADLCLSEHLMTYTVFVVQLLLLNMLKTIIPR